MKLDIEYIEKIARILSDNNLTEISLDDGEKAISIKKEGGYIKPEVSPEVQVSQASIPVSQKEEKPQAPQNKGLAITSPMVGAFYAAPAPGAKPFVKVGDVVSAGQVVCIVEAMKLMNEIESEVSGRITQICVEDGQSVEYGQVLMYVE